MDLQCPVDKKQQMVVDGAISAELPVVSGHDAQMQATWHARYVLYRALVPACVNWAVE